MISIAARCFFNKVVGRDDTSLWDIVIEVRYAYRQFEPDYVYIYYIHYIDIERSDRGAGVLTNREFQEMDWNRAGLAL